MLEKPNNSILYYTYICIYIYVSSPQFSLSSHNPSEFTGQDSQGAVQAVIGRHGKTELKWSFRAQQPGRTLAAGDVAVASESSTLTKDGHRHDPHEFSCFSWSIMQWFPPVEKLDLRNAVRSIACLYPCIPTLVATGSGSSWWILQMDGKAGEDETFAVLSAASSAVASYRLNLWTAVFVHFVVTHMLAQVFSCKGTHTN